MSNGTSTGAGVSFGSALGVIASLAMGAADKARNCSNTGAHLEDLLPAADYANPASGMSLLGPAVRRSSSRPVRAYDPEDWPYAPDEECQKDWDDAAE